MEPSNQDCTIKVEVEEEMEETTGGIIPDKRRTRSFGKRKFEQKSKDSERNSSKNYSEPIVKVEAKEEVEEEDPDEDEDWMFPTEKKKLDRGIRSKKSDNVKAVTITVKKHPSQNSGVERRSSRNRQKGPEAKKELSSRQLKTRKELVLKQKSSNLSDEDLEPLSRKALLERQRRAKITEEEVAIDRKKHAVAKRKRRAKMSEEEKAKVRKKHAEAARKRRAKMTEEEKEIDRKKHAEAARKRRAKMTEEEKEIDRKKHTEAARKRSANRSKGLPSLKPSEQNNGASQTSDEPSSSRQRERELERRRLRYQLKRASLSREERKAVRAQNYNKEKERIKHFTQEQHKTFMDCRRRAAHRFLDKIKAGGPEKVKEHLQKKRDYAQSTQANWTAEERAKRNQWLTTYRLKNRLRNEGKSVEEIKHAVTELKEKMKSELVHGKLSKYSNETLEDQRKRRTGYKIERAVKQLRKEMQESGKSVEEIQTSVDNLKREMGHEPPLPKLKQARTKTQSIADETLEERWQRLESYKIVKARRKLRDEMRESGISEEEIQVCVDALTAEMKSVPVPPSEELQKLLKNWKTRVKGSEKQKVGDETTKTLGSRIVAKNMTEIRRVKVGPSVSVKISRAVAKLRNTLREEGKSEEEIEQSVSALRTQIRNEGVKPRQYSHLLNETEEQREKRLKKSFIKKTWYATVKLKNEMKKLGKSDEEVEALAATLRREMGYEGKPRGKRKIVHGVCSKPLETELLSVGKKMDGFSGSETVCGQSTIQNNLLQDKSPNVNCDSSDGDDYEGCFIQSPISFVPNSGVSEYDQSLESNAVPARALPIETATQLTVHKDIIEHCKGDEASSEIDFDGEDILENFNDISSCDEDVECGTEKLLSRMDNPPLYTTAMQQKDRNYISKKDFVEDSKNDSNSEEDFAENSNSKADLQENIEEDSNSKVDFQEDSKEGPEKNSNSKEDPQEDPSYLPSDESENSSASDDLKSSMDQQTETIPNKSKNEKPMRKRRGADSKTVRKKQGRTRCGRTIEEERAVRRLRAKQSRARARDILQKIKNGIDVTDDEKKWALKWKESEDHVYFRRLSARLTMSEEAKLEKRRRSKPMTEEMKWARREYQRRRRENLTPEERTELHKRMWEKTKKRRAEVGDGGKTMKERETPEDKQKRQHRNRIYQNKFKLRKRLRAEGMSPEEIEVCASALEVEINNKPVSPPLPPKQANRDENELKKSRNCTHKNWRENLTPEKKQKYLESLRKSQCRLKLKKQLLAGGASPKEIQVALAELEIKMEKESNA